MRLPGTLLLVLLCATRLLAIDAVVSHTLFYQPVAGHADKLEPVAETYWQINPATLHYKTNAEKMIVANVKTDIVFSSDAGVILEDHYIYHTVPRATVAELSSHSILELRRYGLKPGFVRLKLTLTDLADTANRYSFTDTFTVAPPAATPYYSGLQLIDTFIASTAKTAFEKNGRQQVPECTNFIDDYKHTLNYYAEFYHGSAARSSDYPLVQKVYISKTEDGEEPFDDFFIKKDTIKSGAPAAIVSGSFPVGSMPSGNYYLQVELLNKYRIAVTSQSLFFQRLNNHVTPAFVDTSHKKTAVSDTGMESVNVLNLKKTFVAHYSLAEIRAILKMLLPYSDPLGTQTIRRFLKKPDEVYMRYYVYNYFQNINKADPAKAFKEFSVDIVKANELYNTRSKLGYETDRGFIYLRYGTPTEVVTVENENGSLPYEIWQYNTLMQTNKKAIANAVFLFYKPNVVLSDFELLHSTVDGEVQNPGWRSRLYTGGGGSSSNSRAEQYFGQ